MPEGHFPFSQCGVNILGAVSVPGESAVFQVDVRQSVSQYCHSFRRFFAKFNSMDQIPQDIQILRPDCVNQFHHRTAGGIDAVGFQPDIHLFFRCIGTQFFQKTDNTVHILLRYIAEPGNHCSHKHPDRPAVYSRRQIHTVHGGFHEGCIIPYNGNTRCQIGDDNIVFAAQGTDFFRSFQSYPADLLGRIQPYFHPFHSVPHCTFQQLRKSQLHTSKGTECSFHGNSSCSVCQSIFVQCIFCSPAGSISNRAYPVSVCRKDGVCASVIPPYVPEKLFCLLFPQ